MKEYNITIVAEELMFTIDEYKEIADIFFEEMDMLLEGCHGSLQNGDYIAVGKVMHAIKGASANLRLDTISQLAAEAEQIVKQGGGQEIAPYVPKIQEEIAAFKGKIENFFSKI